MRPVGRYSAVATRSGRTRGHMQYCSWVSFIRGFIYIAELFRSSDHVVIYHDRCAFVNLTAAVAAAVAAAAAAAAAAICWSSVDGGRTAWLHEVIVGDTAPVVDMHERHTNTRTQTQTHTHTNAGRQPADLIDRRVRRPYIGDIPQPAGLTDGQPDGRMAGCGRRRRRRRRRRRGRGRSQLSTTNHGGPTDGRTALHDDDPRRRRGSVTRMHDVTTPPRHPRNRFINHRSMSTERPASHRLPAAAAAASASLDDGGGGDDDGGKRSRMEWRTDVGRRVAAAASSVRRPSRPVKGKSIDQHVIVTARTGEKGKIHERGGIDSWRLGRLRLRVAVRQFSMQSARRSDCAAGGGVR